MVVGELAVVRVLRREFDPAHLRSIGSMTIMILGLGALYWALAGGGYCVAVLGGGSAGAALAAVWAGPFFDRVDPGP